MSIHKTQSYNIITTNNNNLINNNNNTNSKTTHITSLTQQCLNNLRHPNNHKYNNNKKQSKYNHHYYNNNKQSNNNTYNSYNTYNNNTYNPYHNSTQNQPNLPHPTHLLGFMSQYIQDQQKIQIQQVDQLCCYDRMKKLLSKSNHVKEHNHTQTQIIKQQKIEQEHTLNKAMLIESKMNILQRELKNSIKVADNIQTKNSPKSHTSKLKHKISQNTNKSNNYQRNQASQKQHILQHNNKTNKNFNRSQSSTIYKNKIDIQSNQSYSKKNTNSLKKNKNDKQSNKKQYLMLLTNKSNLQNNISKLINTNNNSNFTAELSQPQKPSHNSFHQFHSQSPKTSLLSSYTSHGQFILKSTMIQEIKSKGYQKFYQFQKIKKQNNINKIKSIIGEEIQNKFKKVINQKDTYYKKLNEQNKVLERKLLEKNIEIQTIRSQNEYLKEHVKDLEQKLFGVNSQLQNAHLIKSYQNFLAQYKEEFGELTIKQLKDEFQTIKNKCLQKFNILQNKNCQKLTQLTKNNQSKFQKYRKQIQKLQARQNQLIQANKNIKLNKQISQMQINLLIRSKQQLKSLQTLILSLYNQWYSQRSQNQKTLLKQFDKLRDNYSYEEMLHYIVFYKEKLSTNDKLNDYILKVLRGIQKIRRLIFPLQGNDKLDPFIVMDKIEKWVGRKLKDEQKGLLGNNSKEMIMKEIKENKENNMLLIPTVSNLSSNNNGRHSLQSQNKNKSQIH